MCQHTVGYHKFLRSPPVWNKTTLITGRVGGAGRAHLLVRFPIKCSFGRNSQTLTITIKVIFNVIPPFNWKLLLIGIGGIVSVKGI